MTDVEPKIRTIYVREVRFGSTWVAFPHAPAVSHEAFLVRRGKWASIVRLGSASPAELLIETFTFDQLEKFSSKFSSAGAWLSNLICMLRETFVAEFLNAAVEPLGFFSDKEWLLLGAFFNDRERLLLTRTERELLKALVPAEAARLEDLYRRVVGAYLAPGDRMR